MMEWITGCQKVLAEVLEERVLQEKQYGHINDTLEDGTGPRVPWLLPVAPYSRAGSIQQSLRNDYEGYEAKHGKPTWMHLVREEVAEAFQESDPERLAEELIQVAALCVSWVERIRAR